MGSKDEFHIPSNKVRRILIVTTEEKHKELRLLKAIYDKTWEELLVNFFLYLFKALQEAGTEGMMKLAYEELQKAVQKQKKKA